MSYRKSNADASTDWIVMPFSSTACWSRYPTLTFLAHSTFPSSGISLPVIIFINVDLPSPLAPTNPILSSLLSWKDTLLNIALSPNPCVSPVTVSKLISNIPFLVFLNSCFHHLHSNYHNIYHNMNYWLY